MKPKLFVSVLSEHVWLKDCSGKKRFYPMTHIIFPGGTVTPRSSNVW